MARAADPFLTTATRQLYADPALAAGQAIDKVAAARVWLLKEKPFFGVLARALTIEPSLEVAAFRLLEDDRLRVHPLVVLELKFPDLCARIAHVAMHAALGAFARRGGRDPLRWNVAHDYAIAPLLRGAGLLAGAATAPEELPPGASAEQHYAAVAEDARPEDAWCDLADPPPAVTAPPAGNFTRQDDGEGDEDPGEGQSDSPGNRPDGGGESEKSENEPDAGDGEPGEDGDDRPDPSVSSVEMRSRELQWKMRLGAALEEEIASGGKTFGERPAWIDDLVRATIEPPPDWTAVLQRSVAMLTRSTRSFMRPSRRMSALVGADGAWPDVVTMPGRRIAPAGRIVAVIDTSASIDGATLARFLGALASVATGEGFDEVRLVQADAAVTKDETVLAAELLFQAIPIVGRGGSDFGPALRALAEESAATGERFTVVYLTDLDGRFPEAAETRPLDVLWVVSKKTARRPPFGQFVELSS